MSADLLKLEELGLKLEELKKEIENDEKELGLLKDKKNIIKTQIDNINLELEELNKKKKLKVNSTKIKNKNFFKLARIAMAMIFVISLVTDCIEGVTVNQTFPSYFNFAVFFGSIGSVLPFHFLYCIKINRECKKIDLEQVNQLIDIKALNMRELRREITEIENISDLSFKNIREKKENMVFIRSEMKNLEQQINTNTQKDRRPMPKVKQLVLQEKNN